MKFIFITCLSIFIASCQFTETITLNDDGSGLIQTTSLRDEHSYLKLVKGNYNNEDIYQDTTYVVKDFIAKHAATFDRISETDKAVFRKYNNVAVQIKKSSYDKEFITIISQKFASISQIADLYKTLEYVSDIR